MMLPVPIARLFAIETDDATSVYTSRLVNILILLFSAIAGLYSAAVTFLFPRPTTAPNPLLPFLVELGLIALLAGGGLLLNRSGRHNLAAHAFFIGFTFLLFASFVYYESSILPFYLLLLSVVGVASISSGRVTLLAAGSILVAMGAYYVLAEPPPFSAVELLGYGLTAVGIALAAWFGVYVRQVGQAASARAQQSLQETRTLLTLSSNLASTMDVGEIYRRAARTFAEQINASACVITQWLPEEDTLVSQIRYTRRENGRPTEQFDFAPIPYYQGDNPGIAYVITAVTPLIRHLNDGQISPTEQERLRQTGQVSSLKAPLMDGETLQGTVHLYRDASQPPFSQNEAQLVQVMASETAIALNNARLATAAQGQVAQLNALNRLSHALSLADSQRGIFDSVRREIFSLFEATAMSIVLVAPDGRHLNWVYGYEYGQEIDLSQIPPLDISQGFSGQVVRSRKYLLINERFREMAEQYQSITVGVMSSTWLGFPLIVANKLIGVLSIENEFNNDAFGERDIELLETISGALAIAINNLMQFSAVQTALVAQSEQRNQLQAAAEVAAATTSILELDDLLERAVNLIRERFILYYTGIFLINEETNMAVLQAGTGEAGRKQLERSHQLPVGSRSLIGGATGDGQPRISQDVTQDDEWRPNPILPDTRSELAIPLRVRGQIIGALTVQSAEPDAFAPELISTLQTMADQLAIAIDNTRLLANSENRARQQQELNQISAQLRNTADMETILKIGLHAISDRVNGKPISLALGRKE
jgi:GAF domain-containing protein